nr:LytS/YhcK type 5TM receptor domain-containing protein [uncultured Caproiciproducens sp.]
MMMEIFKNIILNISLLVVIAYLLTKIGVVQEFITAEHVRLKVKLEMAVIFGLIGVLSTYTGIRVNGAIANTRVIAVVVGGILGGPVVGLGAGIIAGLHRFAIDIGGFTAIPCAISTIAEGIIGGVFSRYVKQSENRWLIVGSVTMLAEICQMGIILLIAKPFAEAWQLVKVISIPMILFNSLGVIVFIGIFDSVFIEQDREAGNRIRMVMNIADECLPHLRKGLYDKQNLDAATSIILEKAEASGVVITDTNKILSISQGHIKGLKPCKSVAFPQLVVRTLASGEVQMADMAPKDDAFYECLKQFTAVCAPLTQRGEMIGTLVLFIRKFKLSSEVECEYVSGLARLFSTQLELSQVDYQKKLRQKAEFSALQSQVNPHFLFNALSTITAFCREKPDRARELLLVLSNYFRNTLQTGRYMISLSDELEHVNDYLELEKARFEDKLQIEENISEGMDCMVPSFILQPIVENAVKHSAMVSKGCVIVQISVHRENNILHISVQDNGDGIPPDIVQRLYNDTMDQHCVGLSNVHKRLKSIYGEEYGLQINSSESGTEIGIRIPLDMKINGGEDD